LDPRELDKQVRWLVYRHFMDTGLPPNTPVLARETSSSLLDVENALFRLGEARSLVLAPGSTSIWMAHPFSGVPTAFPVQAGGIRYWANCAWDALGISVLLEEDVSTVTLCPDCGEPLILQVTDGVVRPETAVVHFLVPAGKFWDDIGFT
jgi:hypothetical protein